tara:strand:- start:152 stop:382 length:231 start_codon:yes stop_codon:yes gene_type:complete
MSKEINNNDLERLAGNNVYDTEYSEKLTISIRTSTLELFNSLKIDLENKLGVQVSNNVLFEFMTVEMFNSINNNNL